MYLYYKVKSLFEVLVMLLKKARKEALTVSVCFSNKDECNEISNKLWAAYDILPHGIIEDGFLQDQPIILDTKLYKKDIAIIIGNAQFDDSENGEWKKVFFLNTPIYGNGRFYEYTNNMWHEINQEEYLKY